MSIKSTIQNQIEHLVARKNRMIANNKYLKFASDIHLAMVDDNAGFKVGAITYYMFLSILPLLLFALTVFDMVFESNTKLRDKLIDSAFSSIPVVGPTLEANISFVQARGFTLVFSLIVTLWAIRKGALALQNALYSILRESNVKKDRGFFEKSGRAYSTMLIISIGLLVPTVFNSILFEIATLAIFFALLNLIWNSAVVYLVFLILVDAKAAKGWGVVFSGVVITLIQYLSVVIVGNSLDNSRPLYGTLAVVLALLIWLSLQIRALVYGAIINSVLDC